MRWIRAVVLMLAGGLAACNLQMATPLVPTAPPSDTPPPLAEQATRTEAAPVPTLLPTPGQFIPGQPVQPLPPPPLPVTVVPGSSGDYSTEPTLDAAIADERYTVEVRSGAAQAITYELTIIRGSLALQVQGPDGVVWRRALSASETASSSFTVQQGGVYELLVFRQNFDGSYAFRWE